MQATHSDDDDSDQAEQGGQAPAASPVDEHKSQWEWVVWLAKHRSVDDALSHPFFGTVVLFTAAVAANADLCGGGSDEDSDNNGSDDDYSYHWYCTLANVLLHESQCMPSAWLGELCTALIERTAGSMTRVVRYFFHQLFSKWLCKPHLRQYTSLYSVMQCAHYVAVCGDIPPTHVFGAFCHDRAMLYVQFLIDHGLYKRIDYFPEAIQKVLWAINKQNRPPELLKRALHAIYTLLSATAASAAHKREVMDGVFSVLDLHADVQHVQTALDVGMRPSLEWLEFHARAMRKWLYNDDNRWPTQQQQRQVFRLLCVVCKFDVDAFLAAEDDDCENYPE